jgi:single-strand DNA-binding protein
MKGVNKVIIVGNIGKDIDMGSGSTRFTIAATSKWRDANGVQQEHTEWFKCVAFKRLGEVVAQYFHTGSRVYIEGEQRTNKYVDAQGVERKTTQVIVREILGLDPYDPAKQAAPQYANQPVQPGLNAQLQNAQPFQGAQQNVQPQRLAPAQTPYQLEDDNIPF